MLISESWRQQNRALLDLNPRFGVGGAKSAELVRHLYERFEADGILDYGAGKGYLAKALPDLPIHSYDPAYPKTRPVAADLVVCADVMEHVEAECIDAVLDHIFEHARKAALFVICCERGAKRMPNMQWAHCSVHPTTWWAEKVARYGHTTRLPKLEPTVREVVLLVDLCRP